MLWAAAALFPGSRSWQNRPFARLRGEVVTERDVNGRPVSTVQNSEFHEGARELLEGHTYEVRIAPGMVQMRRHDLASFDRRRDAEVRLRAERIRRHREYLERMAVHAPMALALDPDEIDREVNAGMGLRRRGSVTRWSRRSQVRMIQRILQLDLAPLVRGVRSPVMITLTLPDRWLEVAPDAATIAAKFDLFRRKWAARWGAPAWIWKREFQLRGAPHFHLWTVPPVDDLQAFAAELRGMWSDALDITDERDARLHRLHGVDVSRADGMRARDPRRLAFYFLKESGASERKAYQNEPPAAWQGQESVGRYWGVRGIATAVVTVELDPENYEAVYAMLADEREAATGLHRTAEGELLNLRTGEFTPDPHAGWVAVPSGAEFAALLASALAPPDDPL